MQQSVEETELFLNWKYQENFLHSLTKLRLRYILRLKEDNEHVSSSFNCCGRKPPDILYGTKVQIIKECITIKQILAKCSDCGKEYPIEKLSFLPEAEDHIKALAKGADIVPEASNMNLYCPECLKKKSR